MRNVLRPSESRSVLVPVLALAVAFFVAQCGDDSEIVIDQELQCLGEDFQGGDFSLLIDVERVFDRCAAGAFKSYIAAGPYGPFTLPSGAQLAQGPQEITITLPLVGEVTGTLSLGGSTLRFEVEQPIRIEDIVLPFSLGTVDVEAGVSGNICPVSQEQLEAAFTVTVQDVQPDLPLINTPCRIEVPVSGSRQE